MSENKEQKVQVLEDEKHLLLDHDYDGIHELDHNLPNWWQFTFYGAIVFGVFYFIFYQIMGGPTLREEFQKEYAKIAAIQEEIKKKSGGFDQVYYEKIIAEDGIKKGEEVFVANCIACHKENGVGDIGPNLTDKFWIHSKGTPQTNYPVVFNGVPDKGMPTWAGTISTEEIYQVVAYMQTLHNKNLPGKEPQGEPVEETTAEAPVQ
jgi:cytochrome c oxidase cbb3-type subunit 3